MAAFLAVLALAHLGLGCLSLAMQRHHGEVFGRGAALTRASQLQLRVAGWLLLASAYALAVSHFDWGVGSVLWLGTLTLAGLLLILLMAYLPRLTLRLAPLWLILALACVAGTRWLN